MIQEALKYIAETLAPVTWYEVPAGAGETTYFDRPVHRTPGPTAVPQAKPLEVATLRSFAHYVSANIDGLTLGGHLIHVVNPARVELVSKLEAYHRRREVVLVASYDSPAAPYLDKWMDLETATIALMTVFSGQADRDYVLDLIKSIAREKAELREDDGLSQKVTVKAGVVTVGSVKTKNPVGLAPFRTFPEVAKQPESQFLLRLRDQEGVGVLLRPADGNAWKVGAVEIVADTLVHLLPKGAPPIIF